MAARLWHKAPFLRLLSALAVGIVLQWHLQLPEVVWLGVLGGAALAVMAYGFSPLRWRFRLATANGVLVLLLVVALGGWLTWQQDLRHQLTWIGHRYQPGDVISLVMEEPLVEKTNSFKALASFETRQGTQPASGRLLVYFKKDAINGLGYGSRLVLRKPLQAIRNAGNPGSFDYQRYCLFNGITHQVFLGAADFVMLPQPQKKWLPAFLFQTRAAVIALLQRYLPGEKEQGLAEALLIGYKDDLDKNLVQAYSNTGVVHIIAISGLHLGLIYWLLLALTKPLRFTQKGRWLRVLLVIASLWLFSLLAGAQPSVLRSALMFTVLALGEVLSRRTNIFNTLACSAFVLLCLNPFWLWDVGFQLSYSAVLSIVLFFLPVYNWLLFGNKLVDGLWKLTAVTLAAQVLTLPISIYHFHQVPLLFLFTNFVAVPLSSLILLGEILLCALFFLPPLASLLGKLLALLIGWMNSYIEGLDRLPFAVWNGLSISLPQLLLLLVVVMAFCFWLLEKNRGYAWTALASLTAFMVLRGLSFADAYQQRKLIVYNVPKHTAVDVISGRSVAFVGDSSLLLDDYARNFHLQPSRILQRLVPVPSDPGLRFFRVGNKQVLVVDEDVGPSPVQLKPVVDLLVLSKNPRVRMEALYEAFTIRQVVLDGAVPPWKAARWQAVCDSLHLPCASVAEKGAFIFDY